MKYTKLNNPTDKELIEESIKLTESFIHQVDAQKMGMGGYFKVLERLSDLKRELHHLEIKGEELSDSIRQLQLKVKEHYE